MTELNRIKKIIEKNKAGLKENYKIKTIGIFGSFSKGAQRPKSDVDILVEFNDPPDIFEFIKLEEFLETLLKKKIDLVSKKALKPLIREDILKETLYI